MLIPILTYVNSVHSANFFRFIQAQSLLPDKLGIRFTICLKHKKNYTQEKNDFAAVAFTVRALEQMSSGCSEKKGPRITSSTSQQLSGNSWPITVIV